MTAPQRLIEADDEFERDLIRSAHHDRPNQRALERMLIGLGVEVSMLPSAIASPASGVAAGGKVGAAVLAKWLAAGVAIGLSAVGGAEVVGHALEPPAPRTAAARQTFIERPSSPKASAYRVVPAASGECADSTALASPSPSASAARARVNASPVLEAAGAPSVIASPSASARSSGAISLDLPALGSFALPGAQTSPPPLVEEMRLLDAARRALAGGQAGSALLSLKAYERTFPMGALRPEASVLTVRALLAAGDRKGAEEAGLLVIERAPQSEHAAAVRAALGLRSNP